MYISVGMPVSFPHGHRRECALRRPSPNGAARISNAARTKERNTRSSADEEREQIRGSIAEPRTFELGSARFDASSVAGTFLIVTLLDVR